jgi:ABC-2 type transport system ATP-binding protein
MDSHSSLAVEASGLVKAFGTSRAVDSVDLAAPTGSVDGFPGPDGAGKSTTIRMLATLLRRAPAPRRSSVTTSRARPPRSGQGSA